MTGTDSEYWTEENLGKYMELYEDPDKHDPYYNTGKAKIAFEPDVADLVRLHRLARSRMATTILEFGVGFSTLVLADALEKNQKEFDTLTDPPMLRNRFAWQLFSVDASEYWINETHKKVPETMAARINFTHSEVKIGTYNGQLCHFYQRLPNIIADFIYVDAPSPKDVKGSHNGLDFTIDERTVMSCDPLLMESTMLPGTFIIVDGRVNNARFLQRNFTRNFICNYSSEDDITTFELDEAPLGQYSHDLPAILKSKGLR